MAVQVYKDGRLDAVCIRAVEFVGVSVLPSTPSLRAWCDEVVQNSVPEAAIASGEPLRQAVRQMLRHGKFKASGRSKPAQEYLLRCATQDGILPEINGPVDVLNAVSLSCGLPISLLSVGKCSQKLAVRRGLAGESYVFNAVGQVLEVEDLIVVCDEAEGQSRPVGSPIKDSMAGKIEATDNHLIAIIYAPETAEGRQRAAGTLELLQKKIMEHCTLATAMEVDVRDRSDADR